MNPDAPWRLHPQVSVRPEPFGALLYHFGTRKLSFLKDRALLDAVEALESAPSARAALSDAGIPPERHETYLSALQTLVESQMLEERAA
ncbi:mycofactocin biosynthesis chaperone MftB [Microbacterium caowuchunii]|uniref:mycofactocin biosynthesis chaperone MftB n=1 Tax=Microbacterium caowuchunii TaxID=2614638 RepID=UPI001CD64A9C|nr:mycofactocin biosynthesis chaperone MftB [Microbacterium caowuchunii]